MNDGHLHLSRRGHEHASFPQGGRSGGRGVDLSHLLLFQVVFIRGCLLVEELGIVALLEVGGDLQNDREKVGVTSS